MLDAYRLEEAERFKQHEQELRAQLERELNKHEAKCRQDARNEDSIQRDHMLVKNRVTIDGAKEEAVDTVLEKALRSITEALNTDDALRTEYYQRLVQELLSMHGNPDEIRCSKNAMKIVQRQLADSGCSVSVKLGEAKQIGISATVDGGRTIINSNPSEHIDALSLDLRMGIARLLFGDEQH